MVSSYRDIDVKKIYDEGGISPYEFLYSPDKSFHPGAEVPDDDGCYLMGFFSVPARLSSPGMSRWIAVPDQTGGYQLETTPIIDNGNDGVEETAPVLGQPLLMPEIYASIDDARSAIIDMMCAAGDRAGTHGVIEYAARNLVGGYCDPTSLPFEEFKDRLADASDWDTHAHKLTMTRLSNAMLCLRYPFMIPWPFMTDMMPWESREELFASTLFDQFPTGWGHRFGLELCEDVRNQAWHADNRIWKARLREIRVDDIKEKFGSLRNYWTVYGRGSDILDVYELLSEVICISCGTANRTRIASGWISPYCIDDLSKDKADTRAGLREAAARYLGEGEHDWVSECEAEAFHKFKVVLDTTAPAASSDSIRALLDSYVVQSFGQGGIIEENKSIGLLDGSKAPNGQPIWARKVILDVVREIEELEQWSTNGYPREDGERSYTELASAYGVDLPGWWKEDDGEGW